MPKFNYEDAYHFPIVKQINDGDCKLGKVALFNWKCILETHQPENQLCEEEIELLISGEDDSKDIEMCDAAVSARIDIQKENEQPRYIIWTAQISKCWHFIKSLKNNYNFGKILLLLELKNNEVEIFIVIKSSCFHSFTYPDDMKNLRSNYIFQEERGGNLNRSMESLKTIFQYFFTLNDNCIQYSTGQDIQKKNIMDLYGYIKDFHKKVGSTSEDLRYKYQHDSLLPSLRNYQANAVHWMVSRETQCQYETDSSSDTNPLWQELTCYDGEKIYFNNYTGGVTKEKFVPNVLPTGGILADEMGLGKTVVVLACILNHQSPKKYCLQRVIDDVGVEEAEDKDDTISPIEYTNANKNCDDIEDEETKDNDDTIPPNEYTNENEKNSLQCETEPMEQSTEDVEDVYDNIQTNEVLMKSMDLSNEYILNGDIPTLQIPQCNCNKPFTTQESNDRTTDQIIVIDDGPVKCNCNIIKNVPIELCYNQTLIKAECEVVLYKNDLKCLENYSMKIPDDHTYCNNKYNEELYTRKKNEYPTALSTFTNLKIDGSFGLYDHSSILDNKDLIQPTYLYLNDSSCSSDDDANSRHDRITKQNRLYQSINYPGHKRKFRNSLEFLTNIRGEHTYYKVPRYQLDIFYYTKRCYYCGDKNKNVDLLNKVKCCHCENVMHRICAAYNGINVKDYECASCAIKQVTETHCTLIVCPGTLLKQWVDEVENHVKKHTFKYMVYQGVKHHHFVPPKVLAEYDLIITSFNTLRLDFNYVMADNAVRKLRYEKVYVALPCPLLGLKFWRMCIDEAQMVETEGTRLSEMALKINAVHRWCVTGTPVQRSVEDIYGLLLFLSVRPYNCKLWWKRAIVDHYRAGNHKPLFNITSRIMWRTSKVDVVEEIGIPKQTEYVSWLQFTAVEQHFYQKQYEISANNTNDYIRVKLAHINFDVKISEIDRNTVTILLSPLLQLRQACCHPAVVRGSYVAMGKTTVSMDELLIKLVASSKQECEESHRKLICALNGLAGVEILYCRHMKAAELYLEAKISWETYSHLKTDSLQKLHTLHNLESIREHINLKEFPSIKFEEVVKASQKIHHDYLASMNRKVTACEKSLRLMKVDLRDSSSQIDMKDPWWLNVLSCENMGNSELMYKIMNELSTVHASSKGSTLQGKFRSLIQLQSVLHGQLENIEEQHKKALNNIWLISHYPDENQVLECAECCLRPVPESGAHKCRYCLVNEVIKDYEKLLFSEGVHNHLESDESRTTGFRATSEVDKVLQVLYSFLRNSGMALKMNYLELFKEETKMQKNLEVAILPKLDKVFTITFDLYPTGFESDWCSMIHLTEHGDGYDPVVVGYRIPALWFSITSEGIVQAYISFTINGNGNYNVQLEVTSLEANQWNRIKIEQTKDSTFSFTINDIVLCEIKNNMPQIFNNVKVYMGDPWYEPQKGKIKNLIIDYPFSIIDQAKEHMKYLELRKKEFQCITSVFCAYHARVQALDELSMCVMRMRYENYGDTNVTNESYIIRRGQLDVTKMSLEGDKVIALDELRKKQHQLHYLENIAKVQGEYDGFNTETCPICVSQLGSEWAVLKCAHCFCVDCVSELQKSYPVVGGRNSRLVGIKCPYCREFTATKDVSFVVTKQKVMGNFDSNIPIKGHFSSKIEAIVRRINWIHNRDPGCKILIFSTWLRVLQLMKEALQLNNILFTSLDGSSSNFQKRLATFKQSSDINVLLSLLSSGSKGLNIIEATHVILVEPTLNPGDELQAVGRVHRIGQTKETFVHRFIIKGTVEEKMYHLFKSKSQSSQNDSSALTVNDLASLFI